MVLTDLHDVFSRDPVAVFLHEIEHAGKPLTFDELRTRLIREGLSEQDVLSEWIRYERMVKDDPHVYFVPETRTYAWGPAVDLPDATQAVHLLASGKAQINPDRQILGEIVLAALHAATPSDELIREAAIHEADAREEAKRQKAVEERVKADSARAFAKVAMELEELIASGASARALLQRIHAGAQAHGLWPIGSAGATIRFDRLRHDPVVASTREGSEVLVVRPGYVWRTGNEEVLVAKAVVIEP